MTPKRDDPPFEELYKQLEETVEKLEKGGLPLEQSIALYEAGMELAKRCQEILDGAEQRITKLKESFAQGASQDGAPTNSAPQDRAPSGDQEALELEAEGD